MDRNKDIEPKHLSELPDEEKIFILSYRAMDDEERKRFLEKLRDIAESRKS